MASPLSALLCALVAATFWTFLGFCLGRRLFSRALAIGAAPILGWAVHSAATLPILRLIGFSPTAVVAVATACAIAGAISLRLEAPQSDAGPTPGIPVWAFAAAALLALVPAAAILPKFSGEAVYLADPIFDHSKIAIIDAMTRQGLPPVNPAFGEHGVAGRLVYYFLWHFSAAQIALPLRISGWEADAGLTWFTAFASLSLMMGVAVWLSKRSSAALVVVVLAAATSLRATLGWLFGSYQLTPFLSEPTGFAGWLFQAAWAPQHVMSAACVVLAILLIAAYAQRQTVALLLTLVLVVVAGFESSTYVGGITFAIAGLIAVPLLLGAIEQAKRWRFVIALAIAAVLVVSLVAPFIFDQFGTVAARGDARPIIIHHFEVLGAMFPETLRRTLDLPAYWLILLPVEFPATYVAGALALLAILRGAPAGRERSVIVALICLTGAGLLLPWLLVSTIGDNNDLGLRAVLPAATILIAAAAAGLMLRPRRLLIAASAVGGFVLCLPDTVQMIQSNFSGTPRPDAAVFAQSPELWAAVRRYAAPGARVANNPLFLQDLTPWPANMSWALLANRSSCFAGRELALALAPLPPERREAINAQFIRVFGGQATVADVGDMAKVYGCDVVVVVPQDEAWTNDPFVASADYRLAESRDGKWRIYVLATAPPRANSGR